MCDEGYKQIDEEMLYGDPVGEQPQPDPERNYFDEGQLIKNHEVNPVNPVEKKINHE